jgi:hypothetical protein
MLKSIYSGFFLMEMIMADDFQTKLAINSRPVDLNEFAHGYVTRIVLCAVSMFKGGENVKDLIYTIDGKNSRLVINDKLVALGSFTNLALFGTVTGMVSSLKGVTTVNTLKIEIKAV